VPRAFLKRVFLGFCCGLALLGCGKRQIAAAPPGERTARVSPAAGPAREVDLVRVAARTVKRPPRQEVFALPKLGRVTAQCAARRFLIDYQPEPYTETIRISAGAQVLRTSTDRALFITVAAPNQQVGIRVARETPVLKLTLDANHEPFEVKAHVLVRLAEARDGTPGCIATTLRVNVTTLYH